MTEQPEYSELLAVLGLSIDPGLLALALTHRSWAYEQTHAGTHSGEDNERLEFLGDAVLGLVVADVLYRDCPDAPEGKLAPMRAAVVNSRALADVARSLNLGDHIRLGRGEEATGGRDKASILADTLEAVIGAVYAASGFEAARDFVKRHMGEAIASAAGLGAGLDWKTSLQELAAQRGVAPPRYDIEAEGLDHAREFTATVFFDGVACGNGTGTSKKEAEQKAAAQAYASLTAE